MVDLTFIHLTDIHIKAEDAKWFKDIDLADKFREVIEQIRALGIQPDFFVIGGDLVDDGEVSEYLHVNKLLAELDSFNVPVLLALGNHDNRVNFRQVMLGIDDPDNDHRYYYSEMFNGYRVIVLDTLEPGKQYGTLDDEQMNWLSNELSDGVPSILILHHPPVKTRYELDNILLDDSIDKLAQAVEGHNVIGMLSGHIHFHNAGSFYGIPSISGGHIAFFLDPFETDGMRFVEGSEFNVVTVDDGQFWVNSVTMPGEQKQFYRLTMEQLRRLRGE